MNKAEFISLAGSSITLYFANAGMTDNADLMRCDMFGQQLAKMVINHELTSENVYNSLCYSSLPCHIDTQSMKEIIQRVESLYNRYFTISLEDFCKLVDNKLIVK